MKRALSLNETVEVLPDQHGRGVLWIAGNGDSTRRGAEIPSLTRFPRGLGPRAREPLAQEDDRSALLRVHPRVSAEIQGVGFKCEGFQAGQRGLKDVAHALLIEDADHPDEVTQPRWRHVLLNRCAFVGAREAVVAVQPRVDDSRFPDAEPASDPLFDPLNVPLFVRSYLPRHASRYVMDACTVDAVLSPQQGVVENSQGLLAREPARSARYAVSLHSNSGSLFLLNVSLVYQPKTAYFDVRGRPIDFVDLEAGFRIRGMSVLVRGGSFHLGEGPRPSRPAPPDGAHERPDGQDFWLASAEDFPSPHLTIMHMDSQSWWLLGADPVRGRRPGAVCLLNVGAGDVNLRDLETRVRDSGIIPMPFGRPSDSLEARRLYTPPSIWWPESTVPLLLEGCAFKRYSVRRGPILNVGSNFFTSTDLSLNTWLSSAAVPRPEPGNYLAGIASGQLIPADERITNRVSVQELPVLPTVRG